MPENRVPDKLVTWFVIHFIVDILIAVPLMIAPTAALTLLGWQSVDPFTTRLVAAALFGIGIESFLGRNSGAEIYLHMLRLKIIWSIAAVLGILISILQNAQGRPPFAWVFLAVFVMFNFVWVYWRRRLRV